MKKGMAIAPLLSGANIFNLIDRLDPARALLSEKQAKRREVLANITQDLHTSLELEEVLYLFIDRIRALLPVDGLSYSNDSAAIRLSTAIQGEHRVSYQLSSDQGELGTLVFTRHRPFQTKEMSLLEAALPCLRYPLRNALQYRAALTAATTDPLTQCGNRQALDAALNREIDLAIRDRIPLSVIMFDFDHFKQLNDNHGHQAGDQMLKLVCQTIRASMRKTDLMFRYGGEEFIILLHKTNAEGAVHAAEKIRRKIEALRSPYQDRTIRTTISLGVTAFKAKEEAGAIIERADRALYLAKQLGRNQVFRED